MVSERTTIWFGAMALTVWSALGCGGSDEQDHEGSVCKLGTLVTCACPAGGSGDALCEAGGRFGLCQGCSASSASPVTGAAGTVTAPTAGSAVASTGASGAAAISGSGALPTPAQAGAPAMPPQQPPSGASGMSAPPSAAAGAPGAAGAAAAPASGCAPGEMCKVSPLGGVKFCSADPAAGLPPTCPTANAACGANGKGLCIDAASVGFAGMMFCIYTAC